MERRRIGDDLIASWRVFVNHGDLTLEDFDKAKMSLVVITSQGRRFPLRKFTIEGSLIRFRIYGWEMTGSCSIWKPGRYGLELTVNKNDVGQVIVDCCNAFELVDKSCKTGGDAQDVETSPVVDLESGDVTFPYIVSPITLDENGVLTDRRTGMRYQLTAFDGDPAVVARINDLEDDNAKLKQILSLEDEDGNGIPDGEDRLQRLEEEDEPLTDDDINNVWNQVFGNENANTDNNPSSADE